MKPANVRLAADGGIRLADFGNAARVPASRRGGTPMFAAPELFQDGLVGCAADAWSFGVLVYTLLAGFPPFFPHEGGRSGELKEQVSVQRSKRVVLLCVRNLCRFSQIKSGRFGFPAAYWSELSTDVSPAARARL